MPIQLIALFALCMLSAVLASFEPAEIAGPARALFGISLLAFLGGVAVKGIRRPVV
jgi:hypothetical protein